MFKKILLISALFIVTPVFAYMLYTDSNGNTRYTSNDFYATNDGIVVEKNKKKSQSFNSDFQGSVEKLDANSQKYSSSSGSNSGSTSKSKKKKHKKSKYKAI